MSIPSLSELTEFPSRPTPEPPSDSDLNRVDPIVTSLSENIMYLHGPHLPKKRQFLAAVVDHRPLLRIDPRERYAEVVVDTSHIDYSLSADAVRRVYSTTEPYFTEAQNTPSDLKFQFRSAGTDTTYITDPPRSKVAIDGLEISSAKDLLEELAQVIGKYTDFVYLGEDDFDGHFGPPLHLPCEGAPSVHQPDGVNDPFQFAPIENKSITTEQIKERYSKSTLKTANDLISFSQSGEKQYWSDAGHGEMAGEGVSGYCKMHVTPHQPGCTVYISSGEITNEECYSDNHDAPCRHTAAALLLAPSVSEHYL